MGLGRWEEAPLRAAKAVTSFLWVLAWASPLTQKACVEAYAELSRPHCEALGCSLILGVFRGRHGVLLTSSLLCHMEI